MSRILHITVIVLAAFFIQPQFGSTGPELVRVAWADDDDDGGPRLFQLRARSDDDDDDGVRRRVVSDDDDDDGPVVRRPAPAPRRAPQEILARGVSDADIDSLEQQGFSVLQRHDLSSGQPLIRFRKPGAMSMQRARQIVRRLESPESADFNHFYRSEQAEECLTIDCLARQAIAWPEFHRGCGSLPVIGMIDTGLNADHAALSGANLHVHSIEAGDPGQRSELLHGTAVASLLVGDTDSRSPGLIPAARLLAVDAFHKVRADERADAFGLIQALDYLSRQNVKTVNLSLSGPPNAALESQIVRMAEDDIVIVAAAGNNGPSAKPAYPAAYESVIAVTAVDRRGQVYRRANRGEHIDLAAPGVDVWTAASISGARTKTGTSYAAPFVTAAAAMLLQSQPQLAAEEVRRFLIARARDLGSDGHDDIYGHGLLTPPDDCGPPASGSGADHVTQR